MGVGRGGGGGRGLVGHNFDASLYILYRVGSITHNALDTVIRSTLASNLETEHSWSILLFLFKKIKYSF